MTTLGRITILFGALAFFACKGADFEEVQVSESESSTPSKAGFFSAVIGDSTRLEIEKNDNKYQLKWNADDEIAVYSTSYYSTSYYSYPYSYYSYLYKSCYKTDDDHKSSADFYYISGRDYSKYANPQLFLVCYPSSAVSSVTMTGSDTTLVVSFPNEQEYVPNSIDSKAFVMLAASPDRRLSFYPQSAVLKFRVKDCTTSGDPGIIKQIIVRSSEDVLAGTYSIAYDKGNFTQNLLSGKSGSITLDCGEGVQLSRDEYTDFYISVPIVNFTSKLSVILCNASGEVSVFSSAAGISGKKADAGRVYPMTLNVGQFAQSNATIADGQSVRTISENVSGNLDLVENIVFRTIASEPANSQVVAACQSSSNIYAAWDEATKTVIISTPQSRLMFQSSPFADMFKNMIGLKSVDMSEVDLSNLQDVSFSSMFEGCTSLDTLDLSTINIGEIVNMPSTFKNCSSLKYVKFSNSISLAGVVSFSAIFRECGQLEKVDFGDINTSGASDMSYMFMNCDSLKTADFSNFNTSGVTTMLSMFNGCSKLDSLDISSFTSEALTSTNSMFKDCSSLRYLDISGMDISTINKKYMFQNCKNMRHLIFNRNMTSLSGTTNYMFSGFASESTSCTITCTSELKDDLLSKFSSIFNNAKFVWDLYE